MRTQSLKKLTPTQKNNKALSTDSGEIIGSSSGKPGGGVGLGRSGGVRTQSLKKLTPTQKNQKVLSTEGK